MSKKIMIDPGHAPGNVNRGPTGYYEHQGMWTLSNYLKSELESMGIVADLTRTRNQDPSLSARGAKARGYDLFISEHSDAYNGTVRGVTAFYSLQRAHNKANAARFSREISNLMGNNNRGAKTRQYPNRPGVDYYGVIRAAVATGCKHVFLIENGFHDNRQDEAWLKKDSNLRRLAKTQANIIKDILGVKVTKPTPTDTNTNILYRVQVGAYKDKANADNMLARLKKDGYDTYLVKVGDMYKVQTGAFSKKANADALVARLKKSGYDTYVTTQDNAPAPAPKPKPLKVGNRVRVKRGAKTYTGGGLASFVYDNTYTISQINGDRVVINQGKTVVAAMRSADLVKQ